MLTRMAKDTEKLIRQLSLISFLMAERRPITALEIKQEVEGYSGMNDDAFARRFYADRAELESLGIELKVDKPAEGYYEAENYSLPPENFYLPAIEFTDSELGALRRRYAARRRVRLRRAAPARPAAAVVGQAVAAQRARAAQRRAGRDRGGRRARAVAAAGEDRDRDLPPQDDRLRLLHARPRQAGVAQGRPVPPALPRRPVLLVGYSHERGDVRVFRLSRIRGKVGYSSKAEHDFPPPEDFDPREYATRTEWQLGDPVGTARDWISDRIDWLVQRHFGHAGNVTKPTTACCSRPSTPNSRQLLSWVLGLGEHARVLGPPELEQEAEERLERIIERHREPLETAAPAKRVAAPTGERDSESSTARARRRSAPSASRASSRSRAS